MRHTLRTGLGALLIAGSMARAGIVIDTLPVGNPGNPPDSDVHSGNAAGQGQVNYVYKIGKYEVTAGQYAAFLNAVARTDAYGLYDTGMANTMSGSGITRGGASGSYTYTVNPASVNRPVNYISYGDALRFANWLHNGQPSGAQGPATTEDGAYSLNGAVTDAALLAVTRNNGWTWAVTSEDEWYKAAYYNPVSNSYYDYPTNSNAAPGRDLADVSGNNANYHDGMWYEAYPIQPNYYTTVVGEFQNSASPYGTFDQGGNVLEWNEALVGLDIGTWQGWRGGTFGYTAFHMLSSYRGYSSPTYTEAFYGFRVVNVAAQGPAGVNFQITSVAMQPGGTQLLLTWTSEPSAIYSIESSPDLTALSWTPVASGISSQGTTTTHPLAITPGTSRFFRVAKQP